MMPPRVVLSAPVQPAALLVPVLSAPVTPRAVKSLRHVAGAVLGGLTDYQDVNACAWYVGGGWELRNGRKMRPRGLSGIEDSDERRS